jgi:hypothetical protein
MRAGSNNCETAYDDEPCSCARALIFLCKLLTFQLAEPKKQHTKNIGSIFMFMRVTIPGIPGNRRRKSTLINKKKRVDSKLNGCSRAFKPGVKVCLNAT